MSVSAPSWPGVVFQAAVLHGLDERARREIAEAGALLTKAAGEAVYRTGDTGDAFFVVASGQVALRAVRRGDDRESDLRIADPGSSFGEEATIGRPRQANAVAIGDAVVASIPAHVFRRAAGRAGKADMADRLERALRRAATRDLFTTLSLTRDLPSAELDALLDAVTFRTFERGEPIYLEGEPSRDVFLVADGLVQIQVDDGERLHVRAYIGRGDFFGDADVLDRGPRRSAAVASGPCTLLAIPEKAFRAFADRHPDRMAALSRVQGAEQAHQRDVIGRTANQTQHLFRDVYRLQVARSLLMIDLESCVRCGHCAWACESVYGVARLVRRGDKVVARVRQTDAPSSLLLPNSCQHCEHPACMPDCPTGAIGRDPTGEVFIKDALCTGCGACAKACPWDNIQMAPRPASAARPATPSPGDYAEIAVKCDECRTFEAPACVSACPTASIFRMSPAEEIADVRALLGGRAPGAIVRPRREGDAIALLSAGIAGAAIGVVGWVMRDRGLFHPSRGWGFYAGISAAIGILALLAYAAPKRLVGLWMKKRRAAAGASGTSNDAEGGTLGRRAKSRVAPQLTLHLAIGIVTAGLAIAHAPPKWPGLSAGSALSFAFLAASLFGTWAAIAYRFVPARLARIERTAALPEDFRYAKKDLVDRLYREVSGKNELVKRVFEKILVPYTKSFVGPALLLASGRTLREEEDRIHARVDVMLEGRGKEKLAGLVGLTRIVVELRALPAQRWLLWSLRAGLIAHIAAFVVAVALLAVHVATVLRYRGYGAEERAPAPTSVVLERG